MVEVFMQRNFTPKFYGLSVKLTQNALVTSLTEVHHFAFFVRNLALNNGVGVDVGVPILPDCQIMSPWSTRWMRQNEEND